MKAKPDCAGQRFGMLVVLGKGGRVPDRNSTRQLWQMQCDCGKVIEIPRGAFEIKGQVSCGCKRQRGLVDNKRRPKDLTGVRFGQLTALALTGNKVDSKPTWLLQCDCGGERVLSLSVIRRHLSGNIRLNCGDKSKHLDRWLHYPLTPSPYPDDAAAILTKYLHLTELNYRRIDSAVEDEKRDRLLRAAWIITYRRQHLFEVISELHERRIISKHLRYCSIDVFWKRKIEFQGGFLYDVNSKKHEIGNTMTNLTSNDYPVIETQGMTMLPIKRLGFTRR